MSDMEPTLQEIETALADWKHYYIQTETRSWLRLLLDRVKRAEGVLRAREEEPDLGVYQRDELRAGAQTFEVESFCTECFALLVETDQGLWCRECGVITSVALYREGVIAATRELRARIKTLKAREALTVGIYDFEDEHKLRLTAEARVEQLNAENERLQLIVGAHSTEAYLIWKERVEELEAENECLRNALTKQLVWLEDREFYKKNCPCCGWDSRLRGLPDQGHDDGCPFDIAAVAVSVESTEP